MTLDDLRQRLEGVKRAGDGYVARCPGHDDRRASLSVGTGQDGKVLVKCHAGCSVEQVLGALGLSVGDLHERPRERTHSSRIAGTYDYRDEAGTLLYQVVRFDPKDFRQRRPNGPGWSWSLGVAAHVKPRKSGPTSMAV